MLTATRGTFLCTPRYLRSVHKNAPLVASIFSHAFAFTDVTPVASLHQRLLRAGALSEAWYNTKTKRPLSFSPDLR